MSPKKNKILLDSNIIVYSLNSASPKHKAAQDFILSNSHLIVTHQNITESLRILTHPKFKYPFSINRALKAIMEIVNNLEIISPNPQTLLVAIAIISKHNLRSNHIFDAYLAATALSNEVDTIATDNEKDFKKLKLINVVNPFITN